MQRRSLLKTLAVAVGIVPLALSVWHVFSVPGDIALLYALPETYPNAVGSAVSVVARYRVSLWKHCPTIEFGPQSAVGYIVASFDESSERQKRAIRSLVQDLLGAGCDIDEYNSSGLTPLMDAALYGDPELVSFLLEKGSNVHASVRPSQFNQTETRKLLDGMSVLAFAQHLAAGKPDSAGKRDAVLRLLSLASQRTLTRTPAGPGEPAVVPQVKP